MDVLIPQRVHRFHSLIYPFIPQLLDFGAIFFPHVQHQAREALFTMIKIALAGTGGLAQYIAHFISTQTYHQFIILSRNVSGVCIKLALYR